MPSRRPESASSTWRGDILGASATATEAVEGVDIDILRRGEKRRRRDDDGASLTNVNG